MSVQHQNRRRELRLVVERDPVVGLADLEAAVEVGAEVRRQLRRDDRAGCAAMTAARTSSTRRSSKKTTIAATVPSSDTRSPRSSSSSSARCADVGRRPGLEILDRAGGRRARRRRPATPAAGRRRPSPSRGWLTRSTASTRSMSPLDALEELEALAAEQPVAARRLDRDDQRARAAELVAESLVLAVDRILAREPRGQVVVDVGDVGARQRGRPRRPESAPRSTRRQR